MRLKSITQLGYVGHRKAWPRSMTYEVLLNIFAQRMTMKLTNMKLTGLCAGIVLTLGSLGAYAAEEPCRSSP